jgi:hypothetical protein
MALPEIPSEHKDGEPQGPRPFVNPLFSEPPVRPSAVPFGESDKSENEPVPPRTIIRPRPVIGSPPTFKRPVPHEFRSSGPRKSGGVETQQIKTSLREWGASVGSVAARLGSVLEYGPVPVGIAGVMGARVAEYYANPAVEWSATTKALGGDFQMVGGAAVVGGLTELLLMRKNPQFKSRIEAFLGRLQYQGTGALVVKGFASGDMRYAVAGMSFMDELIAAFMKRKGEKRKGMTNTAVVRESVATVSAAAMGYLAVQLWNENDPLGAALLGIVGATNMLEAWTNAPRFETAASIIALKNLENQMKTYVHNLKTAEEKHHDTLAKTRTRKPVRDRIPETEAKAADMHHKTNDWGVIIDRLNEVTDSQDYVFTLEDLEAEFNDALDDSEEEFQEEFKKNFTHAKASAIRTAHVITFAREFREKLVERFNHGESEEEE